MKTFNIILLTLLILLTYSTLDAQECGTKPVPIDSLQKLPWFYNRNYLNELEDTLAYKRSIKSEKYIENVNFKIPIHLWIYTLEDGSAGGTELLPDNIRLQVLMDELNTGFRNNNTSIRFYLSNITYVKNDTVNFSQARCHVLALSNRDSSAYNVHIVNSITDARGLTVHGFGKFFKWNMGVFRQ